MGYRLGEKKKNHFSQFGQALTRSSWQSLLLLEIYVSFPWIHHTRVKKAGASCNEDAWKTVRDPENFLKVWFQKQRSSPTRDAEPCSSHSRSGLVHSWQKLEESSALLQPHSSNWLVNAWRSLRIWLSKYQWIFTVNPGLYL